MSFARKVVFGRAMPIYLFCYMFTKQRLIADITLFEIKAFAYTEILAQLLIIADNFERLTAAVAVLNFTS